MDLDPSVVAIFIASTFVGSIVAGVAGFAFGLIAASVWVYILPPEQSALLIIMCAMSLQLVASWKLRASLSWERLMPYVVAGAIGAPIGVWVLTVAEPDWIRAGIAVVLIGYSAFGLLRGSLPVLRSAPMSAKLAVGFANGFLGGLTGISAIVVTIWSGLHGWGRDVQRSVFQPTSIAVFLMSGFWIVVKKPVPPHTFMLFALALPVLAIGNWIGLRLYRRLSETHFTQIVLVLLLVSGLGLLVRAVLVLLHVAG